MINYKKLQQNEIIRFIFIGGINTLFYFIIYSILIYFSVNYKIAVLLATIIGILFSFKTFSLYVFNNKNNKLILKFIILYGMLYIINILIISFLDKTFISNYYINGFIASCILAILTYITNKLLIFKKMDNND